jgi:hypothetical protein
VQYGGEKKRDKKRQKQGIGKNKNFESQKKHQRAIFLKTSEEVPCNSVKSTKTREEKTSKIKSRKGKAAKGNNHPGSPLAEFQKHFSKTI